MTVDEQRLHDHEKANAEQCVVAAVFQNMGVIVHDFQAEISAKSHRKTRLQKNAVPLANAIFADEKYDECHDGSNCKFGDVLVIATLYEALLDGATVVKYKPILHEE